MEINLLFTETTVYISPSLARLNNRTSPHRHCAPPRQTFWLPSTPKTKVRTIFTTLLVTSRTPRFGHTSLVRGSKPLSSWNSFDLKITYTKDDFPKNRENDLNDDLRKPSVDMGQQCFSLLQTVSEAANHCQRLRIWFKPINILKDRLRLIRS